MGIGTTGPSTLLDVYANNAGANISGAAITMRNGGSGDAIATWLVPGRRWYAGIDQSDSSKWKLAMTTGMPSFTSDTRLTVDNSGNLGVGTSCLHLS